MPPRHPRFPGFVPLALALVIAALPVRLIAADGPLTDDPAPLELAVVVERPDGLVLDLTLRGMTAAPTSLRQQAYHRLDIPGAGRLAEDGRPELPAVGRWVAIPAGAVAEVEVLQGQEARIPALRPLPHQPPCSDGVGAPPPAPVAPDRSVYGGQSVYPACRAVLEAPRDIRGCRVALLKLFPVRYDPAGQGLLYTPRMRVRLTFTGGNGRFIDPQHRSPAFERFWRALLLNADSLGPVPGGIGLPACEMLIITPTIFLDAANRLADWKNERGIPTQVRTTPEVGSSAKEIRQWIQDRYNGEWQGLSFLLLFGDVGGSESVPCHYVTLHDEENDNTLVGTDLYYGVMDVQTGEEDYFPDLFLGRISVDEQENAGQIVDKIIAYEQMPDTSGDWLESVLLASYNEPFRYYIPTSEAIHDHLMSEGYTCNRQYVGGEYPGSTKGVLQAISDGVFLVTHRDHGQDTNHPDDSHTGWVEPRFTEVEIPDLDDDDPPRPPVMLSINCRSGWFDGETDEYLGWAFQSFCERLLRRCPGGVAGVIGDTRTSYSGYNDELIKGFIDAIWDQFDPFYPHGGSDEPIYQMGAVLNYGKFWMYDKYIEPGGCEPYPWLPKKIRNVIQFEVHHYHGDPSMEIWTGTPTNDWFIEHSQVLYGDTEFRVQVNLDGALVAVSRDGVLLGRAISDGGQVTTVPFAEPLDQLGHLTLCITRHDQLPYRVTDIPVEVPDGPWVLYEAHQLDDAPEGNGDGLVSPGEMVDLYLDMHNFGTADATGVTVAVTSDDDLVTLPTPQVVYPSIASHHSERNVQPFKLQVLPHCPDGTLVRFTVTAEAGLSTWESGFFFEVNGAHLVHYSHQVLDQIAGYGNQDFIADPGEMFDLRISVRNTGLVYASMVSAVLDVAEEWTDRVVIENDLSGFPNIAAGNVATSLSPHFRVALAEEVDCGEAIPFTLRLEAAEGQSNTGFELLVGGREPVFADDVEQGQGDWHTELDQGSEDWSIVEGEPQGNPGHAWFSPGEAAIKDNSLISPPFEVTNSASLSFRHRVNLESGYDGGVLEISVDQGDSWTDLGPWMTQGGYTHELATSAQNPLGGRQAWSGSSGPALSGVEIDLDGFAGNSAILRFRLGCDQFTAAPDDGWHIDDVRVEGVRCSDWTAPDDTIHMDSILACSPTSATLPFTVSVEATITNLTEYPRLVTAILDLELAGGLYMADLTHTDKVIPPQESRNWLVTRIFPGHPLLVGENVFRISVQDISPQEEDRPEPGDFEVGECRVECLIP